MDYVENSLKKNKTTRVLTSIVKYFVLILSFMFMSVLMSKNVEAADESAPIVEAFNLNQQDYTSNDVEVIKNENISANVIELTPMYYNGGIKLNHVLSNNELIYYFDYLDDPCSYNYVCFSFKVESNITDLQISGISGLDVTFNPNNYIMTRQINASYLEGKSTYDITFSGLVFNTALGDIELPDQTYKYQLDLRSPVITEVILESNNYILGDTINLELTIRDGDVENNTNECYFQYDSKNYKNHFLLENKYQPTAILCEKNVLKLSYDTNENYLDSSISYLIVELTAIKDMAYNYNDETKITFTEIIKVFDKLTLKSIDFKYINDTYIKPTNTMYFTFGTESVNRELDFSKIIISEETNVVLSQENISKKYLYTSLEKKGHEEILELNNIDLSDFSDKKNLIININNIKYVSEDSVTLKFAYTFSQEIYNVNNDVCVKNLNECFSVKIINSKGETITPKEGVLYVHVGYGYKINFEAYSGFKFDIIGISLSSSSYYQFNSTPSLSDNSFEVELNFISEVSIPQVFVFVIEDEFFNKFKFDLGKIVIDSSSPFLISETMQSDSAEGVNIINGEVYYYSSDSSGSVTYLLEFNESMDGSECMAVSESSLVSFSCSSKSSDNKIVLLTVTFSAGQIVNKDISLIIRFYDLTGNLSYNITIDNLHYVVYSEFKANYLLSGSKGCYVSNSLRNCQATSSDGHYSRLTYQVKFEDYSIYNIIDLSSSTFKLMVGPGEKNIYFIADSNNISFDETNGSYYVEFHLNKDIREIKDTTDFRYYLIHYYVESLEINLKFYNSSENDLGIDVQTINNDSNSPLIFQSTFTLNSGSGLIERGQSCTVNESTYDCLERSLEEELKNNFISLDDFSPFYDWRILNNNYVSINKVQIIEAVLNIFCPALGGSYQTSVVQLKLIIKVLPINIKIKLDLSNNESTYLTFINSNFMTIYKEVSHLSNTYEIADQDIASSIESYLRFSIMQNNTELVLSKFRTLDAGKYNLNFYLRNDNYTLVNENELKNVEYVINKANLTIYNSILQKTKFYNDSNNECNQDSVCISKVYDGTNSNSESIYFDYNNIKFKTTPTYKNNDVGTTNLVVSNVDFAESNNNYEIINKIDNYEITSAGEIEKRYLGEYIFKEFLSKIYDGTLAVYLDGTYEINNSNYFSSKTGGYSIIEGDIVEIVIDSERAKYENRGVFKENEIKTVVKINNIDIENSNYLVSIYGYIFKDTIAPTFELSYEGVAFDSSKRVYISNINDNSGVTYQARIKKDGEVGFYTFNQSNYFDFTSGKWEVIVCDPSGNYSYKTIEIIGDFKIDQMVINNSVTADRDGKYYYNSSNISNVSFDFQFSHAININFYVELELCVEGKENNKYYILDYNKTSFDSVKNITMNLNDSIPEGLIKIYSIYINFWRGETNIGGSAINVDNQSVVKPTTNIVYDKTKPIFEYQDESYIYGNTSSVFNLSLIVDGDDENQIEYTINASSLCKSTSCQGKYQVIIPANIVWDKSGNYSDEYNPEVTIYINDLAPELEIVGASYIDKTKKIIYYSDQSTSNVNIKVTTYDYLGLASSYTTTWSITSGGGEYFTISNNSEILFKEGLVCDDYELCNNIDTGYTLKDYSKMNFEVTELDITHVVDVQDGKYYYKKDNITSLYFTLHLSGWENEEFTAEFNYSSGDTAYDISFDQSNISNTGTMQFRLNKDINDGEIKINKIEFNFINSAKPFVIISNDNYIVPSTTNIIYDTTPPSILYTGDTISLYGNSSTEFDLELNNGTCSYTISGLTQGVHEGILVPVNTCFDKAGNGNNEYTIPTDELKVYINNKKPNLEIYEVSYADNDKKIIYYDGNKDCNIVFYVINYDYLENVSKKYELYPDANTCSDYFEIKNVNEVYFKSNVFEDEYGNYNDSIFSGYTYKDYSDTEFEIIIDEDDTTAIKFDYNTYIVSDLYNEEYKIVFTSTRDIKIDSENLSYDEENRKYIYSFNSKIGNKVIYVEDYFNNKINLFNTIVDNDKPEIILSGNPPYICDSNCLSQEFFSILYIIHENKGDYSIIEGKNILVNNEIFDITIVDNYIKIPLEGLDYGMYTITIPQGFVKDTFGHESDKVEFKLQLGEGAFFELLSNEEYSAYNDSNYYYVNDLSKVQFNVIYGSKITSCELNGIDIGEIIFDETGNCILEIDFSKDAVAGVVEYTFSSGAIKVNGVDSLADSYKIYEYSIDTLSIAMEEKSETVYINNSRPVGILTIDINRPIFKTNLPGLKVTIGEKDEVLVGSVKYNPDNIDYPYSIIYSYQSKENNNGGIKIIGFDTTNKLLDYAYNDLSNKIEEKLKGYISNYIVDNTPPAEHELSIITTGCVESKQGENTYYYCNRNEFTMDIAVELPKGSENDTLTYDLVLYVEVGYNYDRYQLSGNSYEDFHNEITTWLDYGGLLDISIRVEGYIKDKAGNEIFIDLENNSYKLCDGYSIEITPVDENGYSDTIVTPQTKENEFPQFKVTNSIGVMDNNLSSFQDSSYYRLMCIDETNEENECQDGIIEMNIKTIDNYILISFNKVIEEVIEEKKLSLEKQRVVLRFKEEIFPHIDENNNCDFVIDNIEIKALNVAIIGLPSTADRSGYYLNSVDVTIRVQFNREIDLLSNKPDKLKLTKPDKLKLNNCQNNWEINISSIQIPGFAFGDYEYLIKATIDNHTYTSLTDANVELVNLYITNVKDNYNKMINDEVLFEGIKIDNEGPVIEFNEDFKIDEDYTINTKNIIIEDNESGVNLNSITYSINGSLMYPINLEDYSGNIEFEVCAKDNIGNESCTSKELYVDYDAPEIEYTLEYNENNLTLAGYVNDLSEIKNTAIYYTINNESYSTSIENNEFKIEYTFNNNITFNDFTIKIKDIEDFYGNTSSVTTIESLELTKINQESIYITSEDNCIGNSACKYFYIQEFAYDISEINNISTNWDVEKIEDKKVKITSDINNKGLEFTITLTNNNISVSYDVSFNIFANVEKISSSDINITLIQGNQIEDQIEDKEGVNINLENDFIESVTVTEINEKYGNDIFCPVGEECNINVIVKEKSGWEYNLVKILQVTNIPETIEMNTKNGSIITNENITIKNRTYDIVAYINGEDEIVFTTNDDVSMIKPYDSTIKEGLNIYTVGYYVENSVLNNKVYYIGGVDFNNLEVKVDKYIEKQYRKSYSFDISSLVNKPYHVNYDFILTNGDNEYQFNLNCSITNISLKNDVSNIIEVSYKNNILTITGIELYNEYNLEIYASLPNSDKRFEVNVDNDKLLFDSGFEITYEITPSSWAYEKTITLTMDCKREDESCWYTINGKLDNSYIIVENGTYSFTINDDAGNEKHLSIKVNQIDRVKPTIKNIETTIDSDIGNYYSTCTTINNVVYCMDQGLRVKVDASDDSSGVAKYLLGIKKENEEITWEEFNNDYLLFKPEIDIKYDLYVKAIDNAGNESEEVKVNEYPIVSSKSAVFEFEQVTFDNPINSLEFVNVTSKIELTKQYLNINQRSLCINNICKSVEENEKVYIKEKFGINYDIENAKIIYEAIDQFNNKATYEVKGVDIDISAPITSSMKFNGYGKGGYYYININKLDNESAFVSGQVNEDVYAEFGNIISNGNDLGKCIEFKNFVNLVKNNQESSMLNKLSLTIFTTITTIELKIIDKAGNEKVYTFTIEIDLDSPLVDDDYTNVNDINLPFNFNNDSRLNTFVINGNNNYSIYIEKEVEIDLNAIVDNNSGVRSVYLVNRDTQMCEFDSNDNIINCKEISEKYYTDNGVVLVDNKYSTDSGIWYIYAVDNVGNVSIFKYLIEDVSMGVVINNITNNLTDRYTYEDITLIAHLKEDNKAKDINVINWYKCDSEYITCNSKVTYNLKEDLDVSLEDALQYLVDENGYYKIETVSVYGIIRDYKINIDNIYKGEVLKQEGYVDIVSEYYKNEEKMYFSETIRIAISGLNNIINVYDNEKVEVTIKYAYNGSSNFRVFNPVISIYESDYELVNSIEISGLELKNMDQLELAINVKSITGKEYNKTFNMIYVNSDNLKSINLNMRIDGSEVKSGDYYNNTQAYFEYVLGSSLIPLNSLVIVVDGEEYVVYDGSNNGVSVTLKEQTYKDGFILKAIDILENNSYNLRFNIHFIIDITSDTINVNDFNNQSCKVDAINFPNNAYINYKAIRTQAGDKIHINCKDSEHDFKYVVEGSDGSYNEFSIYASPIQIDYIHDTLQVTYNHKLQVTDKAGNISIYNIEIEAFNSDAQVIYDIVKSQVYDGANLTLSVSVAFINFGTGNIKYEGYTVCYSKQECEAREDIEYKDETNISEGIGKYIKFFSTITYGEVTNVYNEIKDLSTYELYAPKMELVDVSGNKILTNESEISFNIINSKNSKIMYILESTSDVNNEFVNSKNFMEAISNSKIYGEIIDYLEEDGQYKFTFNRSLEHGRYHLWILTCSDELYSTLTKVVIEIDNIAPYIVDLDNKNRVIQTSNEFFSKTPTLQIKDTHIRNAELLYCSKENENDCSNPQDWISPHGNKIPFNNDGDYTILVYDGLNISQEYNIKIDTTKPIIEAELMGDNLVSGKTYGLTYVGKSILDATIKISDVTLKNISFIIKADGNRQYRYEYNMDYGFIRGEKIVFKTSTLGMKECIPMLGECIDLDKLEEDYNMSYLKDGDKVTLKAIPEKENNVYIYSFSLRILLNIILDNNLKLENIKEISIKAEDITTNNINKTPAESNFILDLKKPVFSTINQFPILDDNYKNYLSNQAYSYLQVEENSYGTLYNYELKTCNGNGKNKSCVDGIYLQAVTSSTTSSNRIINMLKKILIIDGKVEGKYTLNKVNIYYNATEEALGIYKIVGYDDRNKALNYLINLENKVIYVEYSDEVGNISVLKVNLIVEDTIAPTIEGKISELVDIEGERAILNVVQVSATDNYSQELACSFTLISNLFNLKGSSNLIDCNTSTNISINGVEVGYYDAEKEEIAIIYRGNYTLSYTYLDSSNNFANKEYVVNVLDKTPLTYEIEPIKQGVSVTNSTIDLGTLDINEVRTKGINLLSYANIVLKENNEYNSNYQIRGNATNIYSAKLGTLALTESMDEFFKAIKENKNVIVTSIGTYQIVYRITNQSDKYLDITYTFIVEDKTPPTLELINKDTQEVITQREFEINIGEYNTLSIKDLRDLFVNSIGYSYSDNYDNKDLLKVSLVCSEVAIVDIVNHTYTYTCTYTIKDNSNNMVSVDMTIILKDNIAPSIKGVSDKEEYINTNTISLLSLTCIDNVVDKNNCSISYSINDGEEKTYKMTTLTLNEGINTIKIYLKDKAGNNTTYTHLYVVDKIAPKIDVVLTKENIDSIDNENNAFVLTNDGYNRVHLEYVDTNLKEVIISKYNGSKFESISIIENNLVDSGLYQIQVIDKAGNKTIKELYIYNNIVALNKIDVISVSGDDVETITLDYRRIYLLEYNIKTSSVSCTINQEACDNIKATDGVYFVGINGDMNYLMVANKYNGRDVVNSITSITVNDPRVKNSLIKTSNNKNYIMMILVENGATIKNEVNNEENKNQKQEGFAYTFIFYILGALGVFGGGFLILRLRKRVRAS